MFTIIRQAIGVCIDYLKFSVWLGLIGTVRLTIGQIYRSSAKNFQPVVVAFFYSGTIVGLFVVVNKSALETHL